MGNRQYILPKMHAFISFFKNFELFISYFFTLFYLFEISAIFHRNSAICTSRKYKEYFRNIEIDALFDLDWNSTNELRLFFFETWTYRKIAEFKKYTDQ
jgi:hypothetical protein